MPKSGGFDLSMEKVPESRFCEVLRVCYFARGMVFEKCDVVSHQTDRKQRVRFFRQIVHGFSGMSIN